MRIEHDIMLDQYPVTIRTGRVPDQAVLIGIINTLFDIGCLLQSAEYVDAQVAERRGRGRQYCGLTLLE